MRGLDLGRLDQLDHQCVADSDRRQGSVDRPGRARGEQDAAGGKAAAMSSRFHGSQDSETGGARGSRMLRKSPGRAASVRRVVGCMHVDARRSVAALLVAVCAIDSVSGGPLEQAIHQELDRVRSDPDAYAEIIEAPASL